MRHPVRLVVAVLVLALAVAGCSDGDGNSPDAGRGVRTASPPPPAPPSRACYRIGYAAAVDPSNASRPVPCRRPHSTETVFVGTIDPIVDGHLLAIDSGRVQAQIAAACRSRVARHLGGSVETQRLARLQPTWFSPTLEQSDAGALWFRCDVILLSGPSSLGTLPARTAGILARPGALDRYGTCGTASPADRRFQRVVCSRRHSWRARATIPLPRDVRYLDAGAGRDADARCRDVEARLSGDALRLRWSFEWPTREQWRQGQRYGLCWTPERA